MASSAGRRRLACHVLDFFCDNTDSCALTVLQNGVRFHIIADQKKFDRSKSTGRSSRELTRLVGAIREKDKQEEEHAKVNSDSSSNSTSKDSGIGMSPAKTANTGLRKGGFELDKVDVEQELQNWLLSPFSEIFEELAPLEKKPSRPSVYDWYNSPTHFFEVTPDENDDLAAIELESAPDLEERMQDLMPTLDLPKYITRMNIPHYYAADLEVLGEAAEPDPFHPSIIKTKGGDVHFLKVVDRDQPQPTKREIKLLKRIEDIGLRNSINVPRISGLVFSRKGSSQIVGFLQTNIINPTPLIKLLDVDVSQRKRDKWAKEVERTKQLLHDNDIIFGDMKADNFLVDENDELWIIDFGGSYTEGWVDPEFMETEEGDDMGAEKIVDALHDPDNNTQDALPRRADEDSTEPGKRNQKRKRVATHGEAEEEEEQRDDAPADGGTNSAKRRKAANSEKTFCYCDEPESGRMIACDNKSCARQWFHFECAGLTEAPTQDRKWLCEDCK